MRRSGVELFRRALLQWCFHFDAAACCGFLQLRQCAYRYTGLYNCHSDWMCHEWELRIGKPACFRVVSVACLQLAAVFGIVVA
ncbi:hypothetical protein [uncultured Muribaculum sp.]|uniref:hypothetical protein n=1 Tax=uncultured Muribaculum sp. TaxID=1918613 RepID=UPI002674C780|nr:hypothetical protein [uncultured Muribaculum sp.]